MKHLGEEMLLTIPILTAVEEVDGGFVSALVTQLTPVIFMRDEALILEVSLPITPRHAVGSLDSVAGSQGG